MKKLLKKANWVLRNTDGSEVVEWVYSTMALCAIILSTMLIIGYAIQVNQVSYAGKRIARYIEVSGQANDTDIGNLLAELLPNKGELHANVQVNAQDWVNPASKTIQLRTPFEVIIKAKYPVELVTANWRETQPLGGAGIPIRVVVEGQSEVYWKQ